MNDHEAQQAMNLTKSLKTQGNSFLNFPEPSISSKSRAFEGERALQTISFRDASNVVLGCPSDYCSQVDVAIDHEN
jgi:hypothetical protein